MLKFIDGNLKRIKRKEDSMNYEKLKNEYILEYIKRQTKHQHPKKN